jgi:hypothetical protein
MPLLAVFVVLRPISSPIRRAKILRRGIMFNIVRIIAGLALLTLGRKLFWLSPQHFAFVFPASR